MLPSTFLLALTLLVASTQGGHGDSVHRKPEQNGFVPLAQWAKENDFKLTWIKRDESVALTNESFSLTFKTDSQLAEINGVNVWLCDPITATNGRICIASLDLNASIEPILFPQTNQVRATIQTIYHWCHGTKGLEQLDWVRGVARAAMARSR